jgi:DNA invertase Pin-like site-specific DNA recombinase
VNSSFTGGIGISGLDQDPRLQEDETLAFVERRVWKLVDTFVDHGVSGSREKRPALDRMMADAKKGKIDAVFV